MTTFLGHSEGRWNKCEVQRQICGIWAMAPLNTEVQETGCILYLSTRSLFRNNPNASQFLPRRISKRNKPSADCFYEWNNRNMGLWVHEG